ncbi:MAG: WXG100 family type VII secretion target [Anaerolineaceae bacterium]|nr:WXG100 family type VII secretion target [Anaerolineaceae bacterium]MCB9098597.1 WXG100 family type VII secretion target [Anaerolineales bacterium]
MSNTIQAEYEQLEGIAGTFGKEADSSTTMTAQVRKNYEALKNGGWLGRGADAFFNEMDDEILPALERFFAALEKGQGVTTEIVSQIHQAEEEAAGLFKGNSAAAGATGGGMDAIADMIKSAMDEAAKKPPKTGMEAIADAIKSAMEEAAKKQTQPSGKGFIESVKKLIEEGATNPTPITTEGIAKAIKSALEKVTTGATAVGTLGLAPAVKALDQAAQGAIRAETEAKIGAMIKSAIEDLNKNTRRSETEAKIGEMIKSALEEINKGANGAGTS